MNLEAYQEFLEQNLMPSINIGLGLGVGSQSGPASNRNAVTGPEADSSDVPPILLNWLSSARRCGQDSPNADAADLLAAT